MTGGGLKSYQRKPRVQPPFKLAETLIDNVEAVARAEGTTSGGLAEEILVAGLRAKMFHSDLVIYGGWGFPLTIRYLRPNAPIVGEIDRNTA